MGSTVPSSRAFACVRPDSAVPYCECWRCLVPSCGSVSLEHLELCRGDGSSTLPVPLQHCEWAAQHSARSPLCGGTHIQCNRLVALAGDVQDGGAQESPPWAWEQDKGVGIGHRCGP